MELIIYQHHGTTSLEYRKSLCSHSSAGRGLIRKASSTPPSDERLKELKKYIVQEDERKVAQTAKSVTRLFKRIIVHDALSSEIHRRVACDRKKLYVSFLPPCAPVFYSTDKPATQKITKPRVTIIYLYHTPSGTPSTPCPNNSLR